MNATGTKTERKQRDSLNRYRKLVPGMKRIYELEAIAVRLGADVDFIDFPDDEAKASYEADVLFLERLAWDLTEMRHAVSPQQRHNNRFDGGELRGERP